MCDMQRGRKRYESVFVKQAHAGRIIESAISEGFVHDVELAHRINTVFDQLPLACGLGAKWPY